VSGMGGCSWERREVQKADVVGNASYVVDTSEVPRDALFHLES